MKKLILILLLCSGCYGTYYTTDANRRVYYPKTNYYTPYIYKPYVHRPTTNVFIKPNKIHRPHKPHKPHKPNGHHKPHKKPHFKKK